MTARIWLRVVEAFVPATIAVTILLAWEADRRDRAQLASQLAAAQQTIATAAASQKDRDAVLNQTLAQLAAQKQSAVTPDQILKALPQMLSLPAPLTLQSDQPATGAKTGNVGARFSAAPTDAPAINSQNSSTHQATPGQGHGNNLPNTPAAKSTNPSALLPSADLKPLYDFALDCQACQAKLATAQADLADEKTKSAALGEERDAAVRAAKGGSALRRIARAAKWFALGAAAGAVAAKAAH